jgi:integrase
MSAWVKQIASQVRKHGARKASWYCEWNDPNGKRRMKSCGPGRDGKRRAELMADQIKSKLVLGTYETDERLKTTWDEFLRDFEERGMQGRTSDESRVGQLRILRAFGQRMKLKTIAAVTSDTLERYTASRMKDRGLKAGSTISGHTVAKELRELKAAFRKAAKWKLLPGGTVEVPDVATFERIKAHVTPEHFVAMRIAMKTTPECVRLPAVRGNDPADWWEALLVYLWETGQRIGSTLKLRWVNVDLDRGEATSRAQDTKQKKTATVKLYDSVGLLERIRPVDTEANPLVFPTRGYSRRALYVQFEALQRAAGIHLPCDEDHEHTPSCHAYSFHAFRYAHSRLNWGREGVDVESLMQQMGHGTRAMAEHYAKDAEAFSRRKDYRPFMPEIPETVSVR